MYQSYKTTRFFSALFIKKSADESTGLRVCRLIGCSIFVCVAMYGNDFKRTSHFLQDGAQASFIGVGNEDLSEVIPRDDVHDASDAFCVEFVENVVKQQHGLDPAVVPDEHVVRQFEGGEEGFLLPLRPRPLDGKSVHLQQQVIAVNAG